MALCRRPQQPDLQGRAAGGVEVEAGGGTGWQEAAGRRVSLHTCKALTRTTLHPMLVDMKK